MLTLGCLCCEQKGADFILVDILTGFVEQVSVEKV